MILKKPKEWDQTKIIFGRNLSHFEVVRICQLQRWFIKGVYPFTFPGRRRYGRQGPPPLFYLHTAGKESKKMLKAMLKVESVTLPKHMLLVDERTGLRAHLKPDVLCPPGSFDVVETSDSFIVRQVVVALNASPVNAPPVNVPSVTASPVNASTVNTPTVSAPTVNAPTVNASPVNVPPGISDIAAITSDVHTNNVSQLTQDVATFTIGEDIVPVAPDVNANDAVMVDPGVGDNDNIIAPTDIDANSLSTVENNVDNGYPLDNLESQVVGRTINNDSVPVLIDHTYAAFVRIDNVIAPTVDHTYAAALPNNSHDGLMAEAMDTGNPVNSDNVVAESDTIEPTISSMSATSDTVDVQNSIPTVNTVSEEYMNDGNNSDGAGDSQEPTLSNMETPSGKQSLKKSSK